MADEKILRAEAAQKYWKTHDYDIVTAKFYEDEKEAEFQRKRDEYAKIHGQD